MFLTPKVFIVETADNHLDKTGSQVCRHSWVVNFKNLRNSWSVTWHITGSTVVLTGSKGDSLSQWETPIFGPPQTENPLTDLNKICHQRLRRRRDPSHQIW